MTNKVTDHPVMEVYEARGSNEKCGTVSLTKDGQTWIAGTSMNGVETHLGSFATFEEAQGVVEKELAPDDVIWAQKPVTQA
jgi:hypothetical protein